MNKLKVVEFISTIRDSFIGSQQVYTEGSCWHFYLILKQVFPKAECWFDQSHVLTKIDNKFYDITGEVKEDYKSEKFETSPSYNLKAPFNIYKEIQ